MNHNHTSHAPTPTVQVFGLIPEHPDPETDAAAIVMFCLREEAPPLGLTPDRIERAIARLILAARRHEDEHAATVAAIAHAIDQLAGIKRAILANDRAQTAQDAPGATTTAPQAQGKNGNGGPREPRPAQPKTNPRGPLGSYAAR